MPLPGAWNGVWEGKKKRRSDATLVKVRKVLLNQPSICLGKARRRGGGQGRDHDLFLEGRER